MISEARCRNPKFFLTNRLDLYQRTGKIFTARSYHHCNTSKLWVEHKPTAGSVVFDYFGWFWRTFGSCSRCARYAAHRVSFVVVMLVIFITLLAPVGIWNFFGPIDWNWPKGLEKFQPQGRTTTGRPSNCGWKTTSRRALVDGTSKQSAVGCAPFGSCSRRAGHFGRFGASLQVKWLRFYFIKIVEVSRGTLWTDFKPLRAYCIFSILWHLSKQIEIWELIVQN